MTKRVHKDARRVRNNDHVFGATMNDYIGKLRSERRMGQKFKGGTQFVC
jgi:hypothetical protein